MYPFYSPPYISSNAIRLLCIGAPSSKKLFYQSMSQLKRLTDRQVHITICNSFNRDSDLQSIAQEIKSNKYDLLHASAEFASIQALRLYTEHHAFIPTLCTNNYDVFHSTTLPSHISALYCKEKSSQIMSILNARIPVIRTITICGRPSHLKEQPEARNLAELLKQSGAKVEICSIEQDEKELLESLDHAGAVSDIILTALDVATFKVTGKIIQRITNRHPHCWIFTRNLTDIYLGAHFSYGFDMSNIYRNIGQGLHSVIYERKHFHLPYKSLSTIRMPLNTKTNYSWLFENIDTLPQKRIELVPIKTSSILNK